MNSLLFGIYGNTLRFLNNGKNGTPENEAPLMDVFIAGTIAGSILTIPTNPFEVIKIQLQTHRVFNFLNSFLFFNF